MILPVGIEDAKVRGYPVVTLVLMALCLVVFLFTGSAGRPVKGTTYDDVVKAYRETLEQGLEGVVVPDLCLANPDVKTQVAYAMDDVRAKGLDRLAGAFQDAGHTVETEQARIDALCRLADAGSKSRPAMMFGLVPSKGVAQIGWVTYLFIHADWLHLLSNLLFFFLLCGPFMEDVWGRASFLALFLVGGILAGASEAALHWGLTTPIIGASGAISACMGAFCLRFAKRHVGFFYVFIVPFRIVSGTFKVPAWIAGALWLGQDILMQLLTRGGSGVAYAAHIGGFGVGVAMALVWRVLALETKWGFPLDDDYQIDLGPALPPSASQLGVPAQALVEPKRKDISPELRDLYQSVLEAFRDGDAVVATRRARWLFERATYPRDDAVVGYLLSRYAGELDPTTLSERRARKLVAVATRQGLDGPREILEGIAQRASGQPEIAGPAMPGAAGGAGSAFGSNPEADDGAPGQFRPPPPQLVDDEADDLGADLVPDSGPPRLEQAPEGDTAYHREFKARDVQAAMRDQLAQLSMARAAPPPPARVTPEAPPPLPARPPPPALHEDDDEGDGDIVTTRPTPTKPVALPSRSDDPWASEEIAPVGPRSRPPSSDPWGLTDDDRTPSGLMESADPVVDYRSRPEPSEADTEPTEGVAVASSGWLRSPEASDLDWEEPTGSPGAPASGPHDFDEPWDEISSSGAARNDATPPPMIWSAETDPDRRPNTNWDEQTTVAENLKDLHRKAERERLARDPQATPRPHPDGDAMLTDPLGSVDDRLPTPPAFLDIPTEWEEVPTRAQQQEQDDKKLLRYRPIPKSWKEPKK